MSGKVLIDTSVWIEFFRRKDSPVSRMLREFLKLNRACYAGPIAVELYQGAKTEQEILVLDQLFQAVDFINITRDHYRFLDFCGGSRGWFRVLKPRLPGFFQS